MTKFSWCWNSIEPNHFAWNAARPLLEIITSSVVLNFIVLYYYACVDRVTRLKENTSLTIELIAQCLLFFFFLLSIILFSISGILNWGLWSVVVEVSTSFFCAACTSRQQMKTKTLILLLSAFWLTRGAIDFRLNEFEIAIGDDNKHQVSIRTCDRLCRRKNSSRNCSFYFLRASLIRANVLALSYTKLYPIGMMIMLFFPVDGPSIWTRPVLSQNIICASPFGYF